MIVKKTNKKKKKNQKKTTTKKREEKERTITTNKGKGIEFDVIWAIHKNNFFFVSPFVCLLPLGLMDDRQFCALFFLR